jgi:hypothetical protein
VSYGKSDGAQRLHEEVTPSGKRATNNSSGKLKTVGRQKKKLLLSRGEASRRPIYTKVFAMQMKVWEHLASHDMKHGGKIYFFYCNPHQSRDSCRCCHTHGASGLHDSR